MIKSKRLVGSLLLLFCLFNTAVWAAVERVEVSHYSNFLEKEQKFYLYYPNNYDPVKSYPVLYLLHGASGNYQSWATFPELPRHLEQFEMFVVLPEGGKFGWYLDSSLVEDSQYESYLVKELIPYIDQKYNTESTRTGRGICGLSMGGHGAVTLALKHPALFGSASSMSGILDLTRHPQSWEIWRLLGMFKDNKENWEANSALSLIQTKPVQPFALFISCGFDDFAFQENREFHKVLQEKQISHFYVEHQGTHSSNYWRDHTKEHLLFHELAFQKFFPESL